MNSCTDNYYQKLIVFYGEINSEYAKALTKKYREISQENFSGRQSQLAPVVAMIARIGLLSAPPSVTLIKEEIEKQKNKLKA